jgi:cytochrome c556
MRNRTAFHAITVAAVAAGLMAIAFASVAQDKQAQIKLRQDFMEQQQKDVDAINAYVKGQGDKATALDKANDLIALAPKIVDQFPAGTSAKDFPGKTKAKPELWEEWDKAKLLPAKLRDAEEKLAQAIKTGTPQEVGLELRSVYRNNCTACHGPYRLPES